MPYEKRFHLLLNDMSQANRLSVLNELFRTDGNNLGLSYLRVSIGVLDFSDSVFSYNDLAAGETDPDMEQFSIDPEKEDLIPILKEILAFNPSIK